jgi:peptidoglycan-associated lipoprotein
MARPTPPPPETGALEPPRPPPPPAPEEPALAPPTSPEPAVRPDEDLGSRALEDLNRQSPLQPVFFAFDSTELEAEGRAALEANAALLRRYATWVVTVEGHCDERGTAEYNLALGERRAFAAKNYLVSLGIEGKRLNTVSYGKEFPFDPGKTDEAYAKNRRAHFVITAR